MLIDRFLPEYEWSEVHSIEIRAGAPAVLAAVRAVTAGEIRLLKVLMGLRALPGRLLRRPALAHRGGPVMDEILRSGFVVLAEDDREVVLGIIGRFWQVRPFQVDFADGAAFLAFDAPGFARAAMNFFTSDAGGGRTRLVTETRIAATDAGARRRFAAYWRIVRPGSGLIRRMWLRAVKIRAERVPL